METIEQELVVVQGLGRGIVEVALNRPGALNALSIPMVRAIYEGVQAASRLTPTVLVLSSRCEKAFSVGADLKERARMTSQDLLDCRDDFLTAYRCLLGVPVPVIAVLNGFAMGGGLELALTCDLIVADSTTVVGLPEVTIGLIPGGGGSQLLPRRTGIGVAADLILTGRRVPADEALRLGILDRVVPQGDAMTEARNLAERIGGSSPASLVAAKLALRGGWDLPLRDGLELEDALWRQAATSDDRAEGIRAFVEKRPPTWPSAGRGSLA